MPQIFVFTAGREEARQHLADSIQRKVDDAKVFDNFDESHHEELKRIKDEGNGFYAWGAVWGVRRRGSVRKYAVNGRFSGNEHWEDAAADHRFVLSRSFALPLIIYVWT
jgi:hypothetical protein